MIFLKVLVKSIPMNMILRRLANQLPRGFSLNRPLRQADEHKTLIEKWTQSLESAKVPEVQSALDNILGHILKTKQVSRVPFSESL